jgi:hypothetical protein
MASVPEMINEGNSAPGEPFVFPSYGNIGPPHIATLSLPGLTIGLPVWLFSTQVIPNAVSASVTSTSPQKHQPHVDPSPSSPVRSSSPSSLAMSPSVSEMTNEGTSAPGEPFVFPSYGNIGPPHIAALSLPGLTIGLPVWLFSTQVIPNAVSASVTSTSPQKHQPHVDPSPSSPIRSSSPSSLAMSPSVSEMTNEGTSAPGEPFVFPSYGNIGPPHIATLSLPGLTIGLPVWLFSTQVIPNAVSASVTSTFPQEHQPHVDPSPSSPVKSSLPCKELAQPIVANAPRYLVISC